MKVDLDDEKLAIALEKRKKRIISNPPNPLGLVQQDYDMKPQEEITNWQKVLIYLDENKDKNFTDQIADLMEIYNLTNKNK